MMDKLNTVETAVKSGSLPNTPHTMNMLYTKEDVVGLKSRMWKFAAICISAVVGAIAIGVVICFLVNDDNAKWLEILNIILTAVCGCVSLYFLFNYVLPIRARKNYIEKMLNSTSKLVRGRVLGKGKKRTAVKHVNLFELRLADEEGKEIILYWDSDIAEKDFNGHIVEFKVVNNKIIGYGNAL